MKKAFKIIVAMALVVVMFAFVGCSEKSSSNVPTEFQGNYTAVEKNDIQEYSATITDTGEVVYANGVSLGVKVQTYSKSTVVGVTTEDFVNVAVDMSTKNTDADGVVMSGKLDLDATGVSVAGNVYYKDGRLYYDTANLDYYVDCTLDEILKELTDGFNVSEISLVDALGEFDSFAVEETDENGITINKLEFGIDRTASDGSVKIKLIGDMTVDTSNLSGSLKSHTAIAYYFIYSAEGKLLSSFAEMSLSNVRTTGGGNQTESKLYTSVYYKPFTGTIELPSNLNDYVDGNQVA